MKILTQRFAGVHSVMLYPEKTEGGLTFPEMLGLKKKLEREHPDVFVQLQPATAPKAFEQGFGGPLPGMFMTSGANSGKVKLADNTMRYYLTDYQQAAGKKAPAQFAYIA